MLLVLRVTEENARKYGEISSPWYFSLGGLGRLELKKETNNNNNNNNDNVKRKPHHGQNKVQVKKKKPKPFG